MLSNSAEYACKPPPYKSLIRPALQVFFCVRRLNVNALHAPKLTRLTPRSKRPCALGV